MTKWTLQLILALFLGLAMVATTGCPADDDDDSESLSGAISRARQVRELVGERLLLHSHKRQSPTPLLLNALCFCCTHSIGLLSKRAEAA